MRARAIRNALDVITKQAVEDLEALSRKHAMAAAPSTQAMPPPPVTAGPTVAVAAIRLSAHAPIPFDWIPACRQVRDLGHAFSVIGRDIARLDFRDAVANMTRSVMRRFRKLGGKLEHLLPRSSGFYKSEQAYRALVEMFRRAAESGDEYRTSMIRNALEIINESMTSELEELTRKYGDLDALSAQTNQATRADLALQLPPARVGPTTPVARPVTFMPPVTGGVAQVPVSAPDPGSVGHFAQVPGAPGQPLASSLPGPSLSAAGGAEGSSLRPWRLDPPATAPGATAAHPVAAEAIVTPSLGETSSFWLQPIDPVPAPGSVPFDFGLHHAGETVRPPPATATASSTAPAPGAAFHVPSWVADDFAVERRLIAGELPQGFDASQLIVEAGMFTELGLAEELAAGRLPKQTIDGLIEGYRATDEGGSNRLYIEYLHAMKESIERALRATYRGRVDPQWLDDVRALLSWRGEPAPPSAASATGLAVFDATEIDRLLGTGESVSHPAPLPPPAAPGRTGVGAASAAGLAELAVMQEIDRLLGTGEGVSHPAPLPPPSAPARTVVGAGAPPTTADPWRIRPSGMSGGPHPIAFDPWSAPPGPGSHVVYTETIRTAVLSTDAPPGWQGAETPGFARAASGAVELPFSHRQAIAHRFRTEDALLEAELALQTGGADALGWSATRWRAVLADLDRLHDVIVQSDSAAAAAMVDVDWGALEALARILHVPPPSP